MPKLRVLCNEALADDATRTKKPWRVSKSGFSIKSREEGHPFVCAVKGGARASEKDLVAWLDDAFYIATMRSREPELATLTLALIKELHELQNIVNLFKANDTPGDQIKKLLKQLLDDTPKLSLCNGIRRLE